jgi:hypothetical protein
MSLSKGSEEKKERARIGLFQKHMSEAFRAGRFEEMRKLVDENLEMVRTTAERGVITMTLRLAIQQRDEELISMLVDRLSMKRDYIELMIYKGDSAYNSRLFEAHIDTALLEPKDIKLFILRSSIVQPNPGRTNMHIIILAILLYFIFHQLLSSLYHE